MLLPHIFEKVFDRIRSIFLIDDFANTFCAPFILFKSIVEIFFLKEMVIQGLFKFSSAGSLDLYFFAKVMEIWGGFSFLWTLLSLIVFRIHPTILAIFVIYVILI